MNTASIRHGKKISRSLSINWSSISLARVPQCLRSMCLPHTSLLKVVPELANRFPADLWPYTAVLESEPRSSSCAFSSHSEPKQDSSAEAKIVVGTVEEV